MQDDTIKLPPGVHLPDGTSVRVVVLEQPGTLPPDYFEQVASALVGETFERPEQGDFEERAPW